MSTGSGKSAIYQIAALLIPGSTLVISPLISLQRDQVEGLEEEVPGEAAVLNSAVGERRRRELLDDLAAGGLEFLFLAPEQLGHPETVERLRAASPSLLVVDEAHCISEWGHDFRPDYLRLGGLVEQLRHPTVLALTATASPPVREEILERLHMRDPTVVVRGFDRPNIHLSVEHHRTERAKRDALVEQALDSEHPGIVYVATRHLAAELADELSERGLRAAAYHAGLARKKRDAIQEDFMDDRLHVIVATTAFGMGVDKANVRFVLHHDVSDSVDSYYQEVGRGGRDDQPARALLFYRPEDLGLRRFFAGGELRPEELVRVAQTVIDRREAVDPTELRDQLELSDTRLASALGRLDDAGAVAIRPDGRVEQTGVDDLERALAAAMEAEEERRSFDRSRIDMVRAYAEHEHCRRNFILSYFGEAFAPPCGNCDNCDAGHGVPDAATEPFAPGRPVVHPSWGEGVVQRYDGDQMVVLFDSVGYKTLSVALVAERGLLRGLREPG
jgi:ATP-dependent DNA helicase RecQ